MQSWDQTVHWGKASWVALQRVLRSSDIVTTSSPSITAGTSRGCSRQGALESEGKFKLPRPCTFLRLRRDSFLTQDMFQKQSCKALHNAQHAGGPFLHAGKILCLYWYVQVKPQGFEKDGSLRKASKSRDRNAAMTSTDEGGRRSLLNITLIFAADTRLGIKRADISPKKILKYG